MTDKGILNKYPQIYSWYLQSSDEIQSSIDEGEDGILKLCQAIDKGEDEGQHFWWRTLREILSDQENAYEAFISMNDFCINLGVEFTQFLSVLTDLAIRQNQAKYIADDLSICADLTNIATLRFLAAWSAFNGGDLRRCIDECLHIETPFAQVKGLLGQAQLEIGDIEDSVRSLRAAVSLDDKELLSWFQLAKAYNILKQPDPAWDALLKCQDLSPHSQEIAVFMALLVTDFDLGDECPKIAYTELMRHIHAMAENPSYLALLIKLSVKVGNEQLLESCLSSFNWQNLSKMPEYLKELPAILRVLGEHNWMETSKFILEHTYVE